VRRLRRIGCIAALHASVHAQVDGVPRDLIEQRIEAAVEQIGGDNVWTSPTSSNCCWTATTTRST
jgi:hypothetical protein